MIMHLSMFLSSGTRLLMTGELRRSARMLTPTSSVTVMFQLGFQNRRGAQCLCDAAATPDDLNGRHH